MSNDNHETDDPMNSGLGVAERDLLQRLLHELPDCPPPRAVWERISTQAEAEGLLLRPAATRRRWPLAVGGLAAAVLLAVLWLPSLAPEGPGTDGPFPTEPTWANTGSGTAVEALRVRSAMLEQNLRALPAAPRMMRAGTAATIGELEDRIAAIDHALSVPQDSLTETELENYWRERVRLMDSLVQLRYAQARRTSM